VRCLTVGNQEAFMKNMVLAAALLLSSASFAGAVTQINAREHTCAEIAQIIRQEKKLFVRVGIGGRSFRYPPAKCGPGDKRDTTNLPDATGKQCVLDYACVYDPQSLYNFR
jgi:methionine synthase II (cobalamin-independent)